jgi:hypothetical protein
MVLGNQLDTYIIDIRNDDEFFDIEGIASLAKKMVKTKNNSLERAFHIAIYVYQIVITSTSFNCYS